MKPGCKLISKKSCCCFLLSNSKEMDEEQQKHIEELAAWKKEAKAAQDKVRAFFYHIPLSINLILRSFEVAFFLK